jgi:hypothetical protein
MVKIIGYQVRQNKEGEDFITLRIQGDITMVQSQETGRFYATAKECSITCTFTEEQATALVGRDMPGQVVKIECEAYEYTVQETGEIITLSHRWEYRPEETPVVSLKVAYKDVA